MAFKMPLKSFKMPLKSFKKLEVPVVFPLARLDPLVVIALYALELIQADLARILEIVGAVGGARRLIAEAFRTPFPPKIL